MTTIENRSEPAAQEVHPKELFCGTSATCSTEEGTEPSLRDESDSDDDAPVCARCRHVCEGSWFLCDDRVFCSKDCRSGNRTTNCGKGKPAKPQIAPKPPSSTTPVQWTDPRAVSLTPSAIELNELLASAGLAPA